MQGPLLSKLSKCIPSRRKQLQLLHPRPLLHPQIKLPIGVSLPPAPLPPPELPVLQRVLLPLASALHVRLHAPQRPPAPRLQLGLSRGALRQTFLHVRRAPGSPPHTHSPARGHGQQAALGILLWTCFLPPSPPPPEQSRLHVQLPLPQGSSQPGFSSLSPLQ